MPALTRKGGPFYPRGSKNSWVPSINSNQAIRWNGSLTDVELKIEADNRVFPVTDSSSTIADCLIEMAEAAGVEVRTGSGVRRSRK